MPPITGYARELLDAAPDAMIVTDSHGAVVYANDQTDALFGYTRGELTGDPIEILLPERFRATHPAFRTGYAHSPRLRPMGENLSLYARHRDGSEFRVEISLSALQTDEGLFITSTIRDVTARSDLSRMTSLLSQTALPGPQHPNQEATATEAREHALGMLDSIGDAVISTDLAGNVSYLNSVAEKMTGWSLADATGTPVHEVLMIIDDRGQESRLTSMQTTTGGTQSPGPIDGWHSDSARWNGICC
jgi:PAS domain S-box-containing protein